GDTGRVADTSSAGDAAAAGETGNAGDTGRLGVNSLPDDLGRAVQASAASSNASGPADGRGRLRIYLGSAAGVGKTFARLGEGRRREERGTDVVVAYVETHGRPHTAEQVMGLEVIPRKRLPYRATFFEEMDLD